MDGKMNAIGLIWAILILLPLTVECRESNQQAAVIAGFIITIMFCTCMAICAIIIRSRNANRAASNINNAENNGGMSDAQFGGQLMTELSVNESLNEPLNNVISKARARLTERVALQPPALCLPSGKYSGVHKSNGSTTFKTWFLNFHGNGKVTGGSYNSDGVSRISGHVKDGFCRWGETSSRAPIVEENPTTFCEMLQNVAPFHIEAELRIEEISDGRLFGSYIDSTGGQGEVSMVCRVDEINASDLINNNGATTSTSNANTQPSTSNTNSNSNSNMRSNSNSRHGKTVIQMAQHNERGVRKIVFENDRLLYKEDL